MLYTKKVCIEKLLISQAVEDLISGIVFLGYQTPAIRSGDVTEGMLGTACNIAAVTGVDMDRIDGIDEVKKWYPSFFGPSPR